MYGALQNGEGDWIHLQNGKSNQSYQVQQTLHLFLLKRDLQYMSKPIRYNYAHIDLHSIDKNCW